MSKKSTSDFELIGLPGVAEIVGQSYHVVRRWQREGVLPKPFNAYGHPKWKRGVIEKWYRDNVAKSGDEADVNESTPTPTTNEESE